MVFGSILYIHIFCFFCDEDMNRTIPLACGSASSLDETNCTGNWFVKNHHISSRDIKSVKANPGWENWATLTLITPNSPKLSRLNPVRMWCRSWVA